MPLRIVFLAFVPALFLGWWVEGGGGVRGYYRAIGLQGRGIYGRQVAAQQGFLSPPPFCLPPTPLPFDGYKIRHACHQHTADTSIYGLLV